eukprot:10480729-Karenia_brevis.AAC.1
MPLPGTALYCTTSGTPPSPRRHLWTSVRPHNVGDSPRSHDASDQGSVKFLLPQPRDGSTLRTPRNVQ